MKNEAQRKHTMVMITLLLLILTHGNAFSAKPWNVNDLTGIWRLKTTSPSSAQERVLRINDDGTFAESSDELGRGRLMHGLWDYKESEDIMLFAVESENDATLFEGRLLAKEAESMPLDDNEKGPRQVTLAVEGTVSTGTRLHPRTHPSYFELYDPKETGTFSLRQVLGRLFVMPSEIDEDTAAGPRFQQRDFYDTNFWLAVSPLPTKTRDVQQEDRKRSVEDVMREEAVDIRLMPISFFANNTFCATTTEKTLRGRFGISNNDQLWFQVSLFGAGRSVSGSVYSEGNALTHDDERSYQGTIRKDHNGLVVEGDVFIGTDLGSDARPEPVAVFTLKEQMDSENPSSSGIDTEELGAFE